MEWEGIEVLDVFSVLDSIWKEDYWENRRFREIYIVLLLVKWMILGKLFNFLGFWIYFCKIWS